MDAKQRLHAVQSALQQRGVQDVKFCFAKGSTENGAVEMMADVANFLEAYAEPSRVRLYSIGASKLHA